MVSISAYKLLFPRDCDECGVWHRSDIIFVLSKFDYTGWEHPYHLVIHIEGSWFLLGCLELLVESIKYGCMILSVIFI